MRGPRRAALALAAVATIAVVAVGCADSEPADEGSGSSTTEADSGTTPDSESLLGTPNEATGTPVTIGVISDGSTEAFDNSSEFVAARAAADYWNEYKGGINGHPVETVDCETKGDPSGGADCANKMIADGVVGVVLGQSAVAESVWKPLHDAQVPLMMLAASGEGPLADPDSTFLLQNGYSTLFSLPISVANETDAERVSFVVIDVPQALTAFESVAPALLDEAGLEYDVVKVAPGTADMTPQMQQVASSGATVTQVVGNDAFCIAAFNGLQAVGYEGEITTITQCVTDATRESVDPSVLDGMYLTATSAVGATDDEGYQLYVAIMERYTDDPDVDNGITMGAYVSMASFLTGLEKLDGEVTTESVLSTIKSMDKVLMPGGGGLEYQCGGTQVPETPSVCTRQVLQAQLNAEGLPASYTVGDPVA